MYQQNLARTQFGTLYQIAPHGEKGFRQRRRLGIRQSGGHWQALPLGGQCIFCIATAIGQCTDTISDVPALYTRPNRNHFTGHFQPEHR